VTRGLDAVLGEAGRCAVAAARFGRRLASRIVGTSGLDLVREADRLEAVEALLAVGPKIVRLDRAGQPAAPLVEPIPYAPTTSWAESGEQS
jgi:hypothetical protein